MDSMGLSLNPNKSLSEPNLYQRIESIGEDKKKKKKKKSKTKKNTQNDSKVEKKSKVIEDLETIANKPPDKKFHFGPQNVKFCVYLIEKYGEDYKVFILNYYLIIFI